MGKKNKSALANPVMLKPLKSPPDLKVSDKGKHFIQVVVETPAHSRNKYAYDVDQRTFMLKSVLPAGMAFPYDFGFVPHTLAGDGDAVDVLLLMEQSVFAGCVVPARVVGVIEGEQTGGGKPPNRNDRIVAVAAATHLYRDVYKMSDLPSELIHEMAEFFVNYHALEGRTFKLLGTKDAAVAMKLIRKQRVKK
jgi:inorganic pyrophosphatase